MKYESDVVRHVNFDACLRPSIFQLQFAVCSGLFKCFALFKFAERKITFLPYFTKMEQNVLRLRNDGLQHRPRKIGIENKQ